VGFTPRAIRRVPRTGLVSSSGFSARPLDAKLRKGPVRGPRSINILKTPPFGASVDRLCKIRHGIVHVHSCKGAEKDDHPPDPPNTLIHCLYRQDPSRICSCQHL